MPSPMRANRLLIGLGGLAGALGVGLAAMASHRGGGNLNIAGMFLMVHAPALLALSLLAGGRVAGAGAIVLAAGLLLFCGDLTARDLFGQRLFPFAAPLGGVALILGWLAVALSAVPDRPET